LVDAHPESYWDANLYNLWLGSLRALSPGAELADPGSVGVPSVAATEAWGRRLLSTQLASWAELRHDTLLYAKQSYTGGAACEFPDAYVDPYPEFYARIARFAELGDTLLAALPLGSSWSGTRLTEYFGRLHTIALTLQQMAQHQRTGTPHTQEHIDFINRAVRIDMGCGDPVGAEGWYADLYYDSLKGIEYDPTIADVHTQPTDEMGTPVGKVLHVGTGSPRTLVVSVNTCTGPRAYVGLVSSYFERTTENFERLTDEQWATELLTATPPDPAWMSGVVSR